MLTYRIEPSNGRFGTKVFDSAGNEVKYIIEVRWIHRAGELPKVELVLLSKQESKPLEGEAVGNDGEDAP